jgi:hypothetical protein
MLKFLWTEKENFGPAPRYSHAMGYDSVRGRVVLFGGRADKIVNKKAVATSLSNASPLRGFLGR